MVRMDPDGVVIWMRSLNDRDTSIRMIMSKMESMNWIWMSEPAKHLRNGIKDIYSKELRSEAEDIFTARCFCITF